MKTQKRGGAAEPDSKALAGAFTRMQANRKTAAANPRRNGVSPKHAHAVNGHRQTSEDTTPEATVKATRKSAAGTEGTAARLSIRAAAERPGDSEGHYALPATSSIALPQSYRPSPDEEYMNPRQLVYFRQKLRNWREELLEESRQTVESLRHEVRDVGDEAERATRETENSLELRTRDRYRKLISKIERALRKIEQGRYGYCEETGEQIGLERLEARPIAALSLDAQERREHLQKQEGD